MPSSPALPQAIPYSRHEGSNPSTATAPAPNGNGFGTLLQTAQDANAWEVALESRRSGTPQLVKVDWAIEGGRADMQDRLQQLASHLGLGTNTSYRLGYDPVEDKLRVEGNSAAKAVLESELNRVPPHAAVADIKERYLLLADLASIYASVREQYARDHPAGMNVSSPGANGFAYDFALDMQGGQLSLFLKPKR